MGIVLLAVLIGKRNVLQTILTSSLTELFNGIFMFKEGRGL